MNNCSEYLELISAYADNEISVFDKHRIEEHLNACESCSALLTFYREISLGINESGVEVPDALLTGVMEKIQSEPPVNAAGKAKKPGNARVILLRYAPLAACLAVMLIAAPWIMQTINQSPIGSVPSPAANMELAISQDESTSGAVSGGMDQGAGFAPEAGGGSMFTDGEATPAAPPEVAADVEAEEIQRRSVGSEEMPEAPQVHAEVFTTDSVQDVTSADDSAEGWSQSDPGGVLDTLVVFSDAYAWIEITGDFPEFLTAYDPEQLEGWLDWELCYRIPRAAALVLIEDLSGRGDVLITLNDSSSDYAVVFYSPGE